MSGLYSIGSDHVPGLSKLIEECGEVSQVAGKIIGFGSLGDHWDGTNLRDRLVEELADLFAALDFVLEANELDGDAFTRRAHEKLTLFRKWHKGEVQ